MLKNMRVYKLGNNYKYVATNLLNCNQFEDYNLVKSPRHLSEGEKYFNNILRAKTQIKNLILSNDFKYFVTLTFNSNFDRFDNKSLRRKINEKIRKIRQKTNLPFRFLLVPEQHKNGAWHFHRGF